MFLGSAGPQMISIGKAKSPFDFSLAGRSTHLTEQIRWIIYAPDCYALQHLCLCRISIT